MEAPGTSVFMVIWFMEDIRGSSEIPAMGLFWLNVDSVKCFHASGEPFSSSKFVRRTIYIHSLNVSNFTSRWRVRYIIHQGGTMESIGGCINLTIRYLEVIPRIRIKLGGVE